MSSSRSLIIHFRRTLLSTLVCCYLLANHVTGIIDNSNIAKFPIYRQTRYGLNEASHQRFLRSALGTDTTGQVESFTYPLTSRSAAMISGRGFRPGKRYDTEIISFM